MTERPPRFGILILNHDGARWLAPLYRSLRADGYADKRVYLVDNASTDESVALTRREFPEVTVLRLPANLGYSMAYNLATPEAFADGCDWACWQNNDTLVEPGWLEPMARAARSDPRIGVMGPVFREWEGGGPDAYMRGRHADAIPVMDDPRHPPLDRDWLEGSALIVRRETARAVGPLDPWLRLYWEDADFCRRARHLGWRVVLVPGSVVRHFGRGSSGPGSAHETAARRLLARNHHRYLLTDPARPFPANVIASTHLLAVEARKALRGPAPAADLGHQARAWLDAMAGLRAALAKWRRDRSGGPPAALDPVTRALLEGSAVERLEP